MLCANMRNAEKSGFVFDKYAVGFQLGTFREQNRVVLTIALSFPSVFFGVSVTDGVVNLDDPCVESSKRCFDVHDAKNDVLNRVREYLTDYCSGTNIQAKHIENVLQKFEEFI